MCSTARTIIEHQKRLASAAAAAAAPSAPSAAAALSRSLSSGGLLRPTEQTAPLSSCAAASATSLLFSSTSATAAAASIMMMADCSGSASSSNNTLTMSTAHRMRRAGSGGLIGYHTDCSDDDLESSSHSHVLDRVKSDRMPVTKPEEDRRRRTIIVEKKNNSYGFTLQSYGIHYKKEQEIEMITYVDYVEYDGPAYRAGMREGDVILSINGADMEKADHKTLVSFIKGCDTRMRMVVLFEDCVRKVELHMRYIQLQTVLQGKMNELERTCLRERELLEGKWKTHSLPARKKQTGAATGCGAAPPTAGDGGPADECTSPQDGGEADAGPSAAPFCRPALSTEDVHHLGRHFRHPHVHAYAHPHHHLQQMNAVIPPPAQFMLTYQYLDPHCRYVLRPSLLLSGSGGHHHHHHHQQQQQQSGEYYANVASGGTSVSGKSHHQSPDHPMTNFGSNESTDEILSDAQHSSGQQQQEQQQQQQQQSRHHHHHHHHQSSTAGSASAAAESNGGQQHSGAEQQSANNSANSGQGSGRSAKSSGRHCHSSHSCNPCLGHRKEKSSAGGNNGDNVSLDAYDLASPCCDPHCVPTRRRTRHHKEHHHRHKHRDKDQKEQQQRPQRPRSQSHASSPSMLHTSAGASSAHQSHAHYTEKCQNHRPRIYDITAGLASHCSLHSCTSSEHGGDQPPQQPPASSQQQQQHQAQHSQAALNGGGISAHCIHSSGGGGGAESSAASYTTSLSTDTLYWDPETGSATAGHSRQLSTKSRQSGVYHPQTPTQQHYLHAQQQQRYPHLHAGPTAIGHAGVVGVGFDGQQMSAAAAATYMHGKPKSWDNLAMKGGAIGAGYGIGYAYVDPMARMTLAGKPPALGGGGGVGVAKMQQQQQQHAPAQMLFASAQQQQQQRHSIPRKNPYGRYSTFTDVENYAPPPSQFVHSTITTTTITKSTENLIGGALNHSNSSLHSCDGCTGSNREPLIGGAGAGGGGIAYVAQMQGIAAAVAASQLQQKQHDCRGYYSHLPRARMGSTTAAAGGENGGGGSVSATGSATNSMSRTAGGGGGHVATVSEITRL